MIVPVPLAPWMIFMLLGDTDRVKFGGGFTLRVTVAVFVKLPEIPVMVTMAVPVLAVPLAVSVKVLVAVAGFGLNVAVTPLGRPDTDKATLLLKPF